MATRVSIQRCRFALRSKCNPILTCVQDSVSRHYKTFPCRFSAQFSSKSGGDALVELAYDLHSPAEPVADDKTRPVLFLHGLFGSKKNNRTMSKMLAQDLGRSVYALDLRNHGDSPHSPQHDYVVMANDVAGFIEQHSLSDPTIIGHSMGAKTAMVMALKTPHLIRDIVAVDNAPIDAALLSNFGKYVRGMKEIENAHVNRQSDADKILQPYEKSLTIRHFLMGNMHRVRTAHGEHVLQFRIPLDTLGKALDKLGDFPYKDPDAVRFEKPALFVRGTKSRYVPDEALPIIGRFFPKFEVVDIEAGHWLISENPEAFREAAVRFLSPVE